MKKGEAIRTAFEDRAGPLPSTSPTTDLIRQLGSTKAAAAQLGVSVRTVERRRVAEGHAPKGGKQGRGKRAVAAAKAARVAHLDAHPVTEVSFASYFKISDSEVYRQAEIVLDAGEQSDLRDALVAGDWDAAADVISNGYVDSMEFTDVDELELI